MKREDRLSREYRDFCKKQRAATMIAATVRRWKTQRATRKKVVRLISKKLVLLVGARLEFESETRAATDVARMRRGQMGRRIAWAEQEERDARAALLAEQESAAMVRLLRRKAMQDQSSLILQKFGRSVIARAEVGFERGERAVQCRRI